MTARLIPTELTRSTQQAPESAQPDDWRDDAACRGLAVHGSDPWFDHGEIAPQVASRICSRCPVAAQCLDDAMAHEVDSLRWGIWGGLTPEERRELKRHPDRRADLLRRSQRRGELAEHVHRLRADGLSIHRIARELHTSDSMVARTLRSAP